VISFAKKTGDYASLSVPDMKVIALTRMFEREHNGENHIRMAPLPPTLMVRVALYSLSSDNKTYLTMAVGAEEEE